jgi:hypothetical protein
MNKSNSKLQVQGHNSKSSSPKPPSIQATSKLTKHESSLTAESKNKRPSNKNLMALRKTVQDIPKVTFKESVKGTNQHPAKSGEFKEGIGQSSREANSQKSLEKDLLPLPIKKKIASGNSIPLNEISELSSPVGDKDDRLDLVDDRFLHTGSIKPDENHSKQPSISSIEISAIPNFKKEKVLLPTVNGVQNVDIVDYESNEDRSIPIEPKQDDNSELSESRFKSSKGGKNPDGKFNLAKANTMYVKGQGHFLTKDEIGKNSKSKEVIKSSRTAGIMNEFPGEQVSSHEVSRKSINTNFAPTEENTIVINQIDFQNHRISNPSLSKDSRPAEPTSPAMSNFNRKRSTISNLENFILQRKTKQVDSDNMEILVEENRSMLDSNDKVGELLDKYTNSQFQKNYIKIYNNANISIDKISDNLKLFDSKFPSNKLLNDVTINNQMLNKSGDDDHLALRSNTPVHMLLSTITQKESHEDQNLRKDHLLGSFVTNMGETVTSMKNRNISETSDKLNHHVKIPATSDNDDDIVVIIGNQIVSEQMIDVTGANSRRISTINSKSNEAPKPRPKNLTTEKFSLFHVPSRSHILVKTSMDDPQVRSLMFNIDAQSRFTYGNNGEKRDSEEKKEHFISFANASGLSGHPERILKPLRINYDHGSISFKPSPTPKEITHNYSYIQRADNQIRASLRASRHPNRDDNLWRSVGTKNASTDSKRPNELSFNNLVPQQMSLKTSQQKNQSPKSVTHYFASNTPESKYPQEKLVQSQLVHTDNSPIQNVLMRQLSKASDNFFSNTRRVENEFKPENNFFTNTRNQKPTWNTNFTTSRFSSNLDVSKSGEFSAARRSPSYEHADVRIMSFFKKIIVYSAKLEQLKESLVDIDSFSIKRLYANFTNPDCNAMTIVDFRYLIESVGFNISDPNLKRLVYFIQLCLAEDKSVFDFLKLSHFECFLQPINLDKLTASLHEIDDSSIFSSENKPYSLSEREYHLIRHILMVNVRMLEDISTMIRSTTFRGAQEMYAEFSGGSTACETGDVLRFIHASGLKAREEDVHNIFRFFMCLRSGKLTKEKFLLLFNLDIWSY